MTTIRELFFGLDAMDQYDDMILWTPSAGLNMFSINFSGTVYEQTETTVTVHLIGIFATYLSDAGEVVVLENLPIPAIAGGIGVVELTNLTTGFVENNGVLTINPGTSIVISYPPPKNFETENLVFCFGTITYSI
jgi:hypothetical protein